LDGQTETAAVIQVDVLNHAAVTVY